jgi:hypothetical protein
VVFLISTEGKKWSLHYGEDNNGGKKWEEMVEPVITKWGKGIVPTVTPS